MMVAMICGLCLIGRMDSFIKERVYCSGCGKYFRVKVPIGSIVLNGMIRDHKDATRDRVGCPRCNSFGKCRSVKS